MVKKATTSLELLDSTPQFSLSSYFTRNILQSFFRNDLTRYDIACFSLTYLGLVILTTDLGEGGRQFCMFLNLLLE